MPRRTRWLVVATLLAVGLAAPGCGLRHHTIATRTGTLMINPPSGTVGTSFSLTAGGFRPGEALTFEVDIPGRVPFIGPSHTSDPAGTVTSTYVPLSGDPAGVYTIKAVGNEGTKALGTLTVAG